jgi:hypothetical protein
VAVLEEIGLFLQANGFGTLGTSIFLSLIPQDPPGGGQDAVLGLFEVPGLGPLHTHDLLGPSVERPAVQLRWRGAPFGYAAARQQAGAAFRLLDSIVNQQINGVFYQSIQALQSPFGQPSDEWQRPFVLFEIICARDAQVP